MATPRLPNSGIFTSSGKENSNESALLGRLRKAISEIPPVLESSAAVIDAINSIQDQVIKKGTIDPESQKLLISYYETAQLENTKTVRAVKKSLETIYAIRNLRHQKIKSLLQSQRSSLFFKLLQVTAARLPLWVPKHNEPPPQLCGAIEALPSYIARSGDLVAALVKQSGEDRWIVAEAVAFKHGKYEVEDIDVKETHRNFTLEKKCVKPLPLMRADPVLSPTAFFPSKTYVLAMYPHTTCFFKALVNAPPKTSSDGYEVFFEDDYKKYTIMMIVAQRFVISAPSPDIVCQDNVNSV